ncbi:hypothetical protein P7C70_g3428, partial [Phenoliferia sp. Uapishka_3]
MAEDQTESNVAAKGLLDLPNEILASIVREVAPLGGRKAQNVRLVNHHLSTVATPIFFASISIPKQSSDEYDQFLASLLTNRHNINKTARSLAYHLHLDKHAAPAGIIESLGDLERVSLLASSDDSSLPTVLDEALAGQSQLHTLSLSRFQIDIQPYPAVPLLERCKLALRHLILDRMSGDGVIGKRAEATSTSITLSKGRSSVKVLEVYNPTAGIGDGETRYVVMAIYAFRHSVLDIVIEWNEATTNVGDNLLVNGLLTNVTNSVRIQGLASLFDSQLNPTTHTSTSAYVVTLLNSMGVSRLPKLSLPITKSFNVNLAFGSLEMPKLQYLSFSTCPRTVYAAKPDLLDYTTLNALSRFLSTTKIPSLHTLHLVGWLDTSGISTLATVPPKDLVAKNICAYALLGILRMQGVRTLVLENSNGHPDGEKKCFFEREKDSDEWTVRDSGLPPFTSTYLNVEAQNWCGSTQSLKLLSKRLAASRTLLVLPQGSPFATPTATNRLQASIEEMADDLSNPSPQLGAKGLLDLPDELLANIVRAIAPFGGRKAQDLRLVNRHLSTVATPVLFSSIQITDPNTDAYDGLLAYVMTDRGSIKERAHSLTYQLCDDRHALPAAAIECLVNLQRLSLLAPYDKSKLPDVLDKALSGHPHLSTLALTNFEFGTKSFEEGSLLGRCPGVRHLILDRMSGDGVYATRRQDGQPNVISITPKQIKTLEIYNPNVSTGSAETRYVLFTLFACRKNLRDVVLEWKEADSSVADHKLKPKLLSKAARSLKIQGLASLFHAEYNPTRHLTTSTYMVLFLASVGCSKLPKLCLPVTKSFDVNPVFLTLRMPTLKYLGLCSPPRALYEEKPDLLNAATFPPLSKLLSSSIFPSLHTLHLIGWLDSTGIASLATILPEDLAGTNVYVFGLLGHLKTQKIGILILENSNGHPDGEEKCIFERDVELGEWTVRLVRHW